MSGHTGPEKTASQNLRDAPLVTAEANSGNTAAAPSSNTPGTIAPAETEQVA